MLQTNSKKAIENTRVYILKHFTGKGYGFSGDENDFHDVAAFIYKCFIDEKCKYSESYYSRIGYSKKDIFEEWAAGLTSVIDTCYYYNRSAVDDLAEILEENETEKKKYNDERKAEKLLTYLIYREISNEAK